MTVEITRSEPGKILEYTNLFHLNQKAFNSRFSELEVADEMDKRTVVVTALGITQTTDCIFVNGIKRAEKVVYEDRNELFFSETKILYGKDSNGRLVEVEITALTEGVYYRFKLEDKETTTQLESTIFSLDEQRIMAKAVGIKFSLYKFNY